MNWLVLLSMAGSTAWIAWVFACAILRWAKTFDKEPPAGLRTLREEIRPFALPAMLLGYLPNVLSGAMGFWGYFGFANALGCWLIYRNDKDDDDRWKRRREQLSGKVAEVGGKLVVVPAGDPS